MRLRTIYILLIVASQFTYACYPNRNKYSRKAQKKARQGKRPKACGCTSYIAPQHFAYKNHEV